MSWDHAKGRAEAARMDVSDARIDRLVTTALARVEAQEQKRVVSPSLIERCRLWLAGFDAIPRFAVPIAAAAGLGIVVGRHLQATDGLQLLTDLLSYSSSYTMVF
ncbi:conserved hypothetical protein [Candidatus Terasakiella magnetica]|nr:conserved hypothetical protein [Candidatus Terasakiella magnetica]